MRYRRAERCLLRAEMALEAGLEADARTALDEARSLNPSTPDLETLQARIAERRAVVAAASRRALATRASVAAAVLLAGVLATFAFWPDRSVVIQSTATTPPVAHTATSAVEAATVPRTQAPPPVETRPA